jgi:hypothetical protein
MLQGGHEKCQVHGAVAEGETMGITEGSRYSRTILPHLPQHHWCPVEARRQR